MSKEYTYPKVMHAIEELVHSVPSKLKPRVVFTVTREEFRAVVRFMYSCIGKYDRMSDIKAPIIYNGIQILIAEPQGRFRLIDETNPPTNRTTSDRPE